MNYCDPSSSSRCHDSVIFDVFSPTKKCLLRPNQFGPLHRSKERLRRDQGHPGNTSPIQSNTKFWLNPIFFYSSDAHKRWIPNPPKKGNWTQLLELQFDKEESRERVGKHNFLGDTGGIKCTYYTLECSLSRQVCGQNPQKKVFLEYNHWYRAVGISGYDDGLRNHNL